MLSKLGAQKTSPFRTQHDVFTTALDNKLYGKSLYPHQLEALNKIRSIFINGNVASCILPTGTGKSGIAVLTPYIVNAVTVLIITPSKTITKQLTDDFGPQGFLKNRGLITDSVEDQQKFIPSINSVTQTKLLYKVGTSDITIVNAHKFGTNSNWKLSGDVGLEKLPENTFNLVIVDESHHYPATTWKNIVNYFQKSKILFLTATPKAAQMGYPSYILTKKEAIDGGIIRDTKFCEVDGPNIYQEVADAIQTALQSHNSIDQRNQHKAMVLTRTKEDAYAFINDYNNIYPGQARGYYGKGETSKKVDLDEFGTSQSNFTVMVVCGKLLEGYDNKSISVVAIVRKVAPATKVTFTQFIGRCVRKCDNQDKVTATVISHATFEQRSNYNFYYNNEWAEIDPEEDNNIEDDE